LATSRGKHIHVDVFLRYLPEKLRLPAAVAGWIAAAAVCVGATIGFIDYIDIAEFRANATQPCPGDPSKTCDTPTGEKLAEMGRTLSADLFLLGRQASLDVRTLPHVIAGSPYDQWMTTSEWNAWLDGADWSAHFETSAVDALRMDPSAPTVTRMPQVTVPGTGEQARGLLIREFNLVFPLGLAIIAIKFLIRVLLVLSGHIELHPESELDEEDLKRAHERDEAAAREMAT
jgi:TRAP-type C4-dicarboxylate transport system permease small subunit